ncbi:MAG TPA: ACT domain-containing protein, partial [Chloroflexi bacterium]|nr:ACT domain-containing protein [Chloroflexota bacterium]
ELARRDIDRVWSQRDVVIISAVGAGLRDTPGVAARLFNALATEGINIIAIAQGSSECSISLVVKSTQATQAVLQIHKEVIAHG